MTISPSKDEEHLHCRWFDPGYFNAANMTNLTAATKYYYRVGDTTAVSPPPLCSKLACCQSVLLRCSFTVTVQAK